MEARQTRGAGAGAWHVFVIASIAALLAYTSWVVFGRPDPSQPDFAASLLLIALALLEAEAAAVARDVALSPRLHRASRELLEEADRDLYRVKRARREASGASRG
jgi:hypothetical protein